MLKKLILAVLICTPAASLSAAELGPVRVSGSVGIEARAFTQKARFTGQKDKSEISMLINPEFRYRSADRNHQFSFIPFYRIDSRDDARDHFDVREAYWLYRGWDDWELLLGVNKVFWGVAESRHLVNIINQIDAVEDLDGEDYLGQPMINLTTQRDWGRIDLFALPGFRERTFPGRNGRFRAGLRVDQSGAIYESGAEEKHIDFAARYSHYIGDWDIGVSHFYGTGREPRFVTTGAALTPVYDIINQTGIDLQYTHDAWLWKFEGIVREGQGDTFAAAVGGFEYTFYQVFESAADIGVLTEYLYDGRDATAPASGQDEDIFLAARLALNDTQDTEILAGFTIDPDTNERFYNLEAERRLGQNYEIEFRGRFFSGAGPTEDAFAFDRDDYIQIRLSRFF